MKSASLRRFLLVSLAGSVWVLCPAGTTAQHPCCLILDAGDTNSFVMRSGTVYALQTRTRPVQFPNPEWDYSIAFSFGFGTDEVPVEGEILDSVTLVLRNAKTGTSAVLFTADANGVAWMPYTPGFLPLLEGVSDLGPAELPDLETVPAQMLAYEVAFAVPAVLALESSDLILALYDYPNGLNSVAWLGPVAVIPPPGKLEVSSSGVFRSVGPVGGDFLPGSQTYALTNAGGQMLRWRATPDVSWLAAAPATGTLDPGLTTNVTVRVRDWARAFLPGNYTTRVVFSDLTLGTDVSIPTVQLDVAGPPRAVSRFEGNG